jgi:hypothetical protein
VRSCWETSEREMNKWISNDKKYTNDKGVSGVMGSLEGAERWTESVEECLSIQEMEGGGYH